MKNEIESAQQLEQIPDELLSKITAGSDFVPVHHGDDELTYTYNPKKFPDRHSPSKPKKPKLG